MMTIETMAGTQSRLSRAPAETPIVFLVSDDDSVRDSLESLIQTDEWRSETFGTAPQFQARARSPFPSCVILDVAMTGANGLELQKYLALNRPDMPVIFITPYSDVRMTVQAMKAGAIEVLTKPIDEDAMVGAIRFALERSRRMLDREAKLQGLRQSYGSLTPREREVMSLVVSGLLNKQVGGELGISEITVKAHRGQVMRKMKAESLPALVKMVTSLEQPAAAAW
jgi:FixJ family two-component response regulator